MKLKQREIEVGTLKLSARAKKYVNEILETNRLSYGPFTKKFEGEFARLHETRFCVASNSGTSALYVALGALKEIHGWADGDEVLVPATTFVATSNIVIYNQMTPVFVDVDADHFTMDPALIEKAITSKTRCILVVHLLGQPADMKPIFEIAQKHHLKIIEDSAETMYARYQDKMVGGLGDIACFSTYVAHLLTTGVGGLNTTNNPDYAIKLRSLINHGRDSIYLNIDDDNEKKGEELNLIIKKRFSFVSFGHSFRITELESAIGLAQLEESFVQSVEQRRKNALYLIQQLSSLSDKIQLAKIRPGNEHSFMVFPIVVRHDTKVKLVEFLESRGIETRDLLPLINQPVYQKAFKIKKEDFPISNKLVESAFYIGCHQDLTFEDLDYVAENLIEFFKK